ncbi:hypothetical protein [Limosilactobacillus reuteri]|uniref:hypothetical protein n=1 Tax=Limosilactobacillus reuteri TaxID=1598 RepID=UPI003F9976A8
MKDQNSKMLQAVASAKDIGFNEGLGERVDDIVNQFEGIKIDFHNSKLNLQDTARENQIMNADFKNAAQHLEANTQTINKKLVPSIQKLTQYLSQGIKYNPGPVAKDLYQVFSSETGKTVDQVISTEVKNKLINIQSETNQAKLSAQLASKTAQNALNELTNDLYEFKKVANQYLIEFSIILGLTILTPGWYKILTLAFSTTISFLFNQKNSKE